MKHFSGMLDGLAFLRLTDIEEGLQYLQDNIPENVPRLEELFIYFDTVYGRGPFINMNNQRNVINLRRQPPLFPPDLWNVHDVTLANQDRTNNACEGWNHGFYNLVGHANPTVWTVIKAFQNDSVINKTSILQIDRGEPPVKKIRRITLDFQKRLRTLCENLRDGRRTAIQTLRAVGHAIVLTREH